MNSLHPEISQLVRLLDEAYDHAAWHGPNLRESLSRVPLKQLIWRPSLAAHNMWEIALHCAYWKYVVWRRINGEKRGSFPLKGSDWFTRPEGESNWKADFALLDEIHAKLCKAVVQFDPEQLHQPLGNATDAAHFIRGAALHDVYHAGQIQLLKQQFRALKNR